MNIKLPVVARLRLPDGREFDCHTDCLDQYADGQLFWWTDGNGACDCNRSTYLNREHNLGLVSPELEGCLECGDTITLVSLSVDGKEIYREELI